MLRLFAFVILVLIAVALVYAVANALRLPDPIPWIAALLTLAGGILWIARDHGRPVA